MPVKLIQNLLLLNPPLPVTRFSHMKPNSTLKPPRVVPIFSRVFPLKLKYQSLSKRIQYPNVWSQIEPQLGSVCEFSTGRPSSEIKASKSLIADEAELSDWVSELRSDSFRSSKTKLYSDSDDNGDSGRGRNGVSSVKRRRESDSDGYGNSSRGRGGYSSRGRGNRDSFDSPSRDSSRGNGWFSGDFEGKRENGSRGWGREGDSNDYGMSSRGRGALSSRGRGGENGSRGWGRKSDSNDYGMSSRERGALSSRGRGENGSRDWGRESDSNDYGMSSRGRGTLSSRGRGGENGSRGWGRESDSNDYGMSSRGRGALSSRGRGGLSSRGRGGLMNRGRGNRDSNDNGRGGFSNRGRGRGGWDSNGNGRGVTSNRGRGRGRGGRDSFESFSQDSMGKVRFGDEMEGRNERFMSGRKDNGSRGGRNSLMGSRGGRGSELGSGRDQRSGRGGGLRIGINASKTGGLMMSDIDDIDGVEEEDNEDESEELGKVRDSFRELFSEEDSEEDGEAVDEDDYEEVFKTASSFSKLEIKDGSAISLTSSHGGSDSYLSATRFDQCSISSLSLKALKDAGYEKMTVVQEQTLPVILKGKDVLAKARTGTGKTVAFLLPSIEVVSKSPPVGRDQTRPPILVLVMCPTRELASQAAAEADKLLKYHSSIGVQVVIGGTRLALEQKRMQANPCQILVATPGRLKDHIENTTGFATRLMGVKVLVLDEADHLLDMGFRKDIEKIIAAVPKERQTLLFSATVPQEVRQICHIALKRDHEYINTVEEGSEETNAQVRQTHLVAPLDMHFPLLYVLLKEHIADDVDYKVLVFCTTAMVTRLVADLLGVLNLNVREIHSRKPQSYRTRVSDEFRKSKGLILVTSDVSARGVDYPDVSLVIQVGLPADKEQYIHRLGRTGRKGKEGQGILLLAPWEEFFLSTLEDLPISKVSSPLVDSDTKEKVDKALTNVEMKNKEAAYQAWLGYYNSNKTVSKDKCRLVELANDFSRCMGLDNPPAISKLVLGKMGLKNVPGLRYK